MKVEELQKQKDQAYWERNQLVAALSKLFPAYLAKHPKEDSEWEDDWRTIVVIEIPPFQRMDRMNGFETEVYYRGVQLTWHIHDTDIPLFDHLSYRLENYQWDGHTTEEKYKRLRTQIDASAYKKAFKMMPEIKEIKPE